MAYKNVLVIGQRSVTICKHYKSRNTSDQHCYYAFGIDNVACSLAKFKELPGDCSYILRFAICRP